MRTLITVSLSFLGLFLAALSSRPTQADDLVAATYPRLAFPFANDGDLDDRILLNDVGIVSERISPLVDPSVLSFTSQGEIFGDEFFRLRFIVERALMVKQLPFADAHQIALQVEKAAVTAKQVSWEGYTDLLQSQGLLGPGESEEALRAAVLRTYRRYFPNRGYDIPYLAGYNVAGTQMFIDRKFPTQVTNGWNYDIFLTLHEVVEKSLLDVKELGFKYQEAHQCAQRAEKAAVEAAGIAWAIENQFMGEQIASVYVLPKLAPPDFDLTPYVDELDTEYVDALRVAMKGK